MSTFTPKYIQIQDSILNWIETGDLKPGDLVPSERKLCEQFDVSRMTVRHAISTLVSHGIVRRVQGLGTYVNEPKNEYDIGLLVSFTESALRKGLKPSGKLLKFDLILANEKIAGILNINLGQKVYHLVRVRFGNNEPFTLSWVRKIRSGKQFHLYNLERRIQYCTRKNEANFRTGSCNRI